MISVRSGFWAGYGVNIRAIRAAAEGAGGRLVLRALIFDLDGRLIDSAADLVRRSAPLLAALDSLGEGPAIYVGDGEIDAETARRAGVPFLLFTEGCRKAPLEKIPYHRAFGSFDDIAGLVAELLTPARARLLLRYKRRMSFRGKCKKLPLGRYGTLVLDAGPETKPGHTPGAPEGIFAVLSSPVDLNDDLGQIKAATPCRVPRSGTPMS